MNVSVLVEKHHPTPLVDLHTLSPAAGRILVYIGDWTLRGERKAPLGWCIICPVTWMIISLESGAVYPLRETTGKARLANPGETVIASYKQ